MRRILVGLGIVLAALLLAPAVAVGDGGNEDLSAKTLVEQAIGLLRSQPDRLELIEDKIADALEDDETEGVDLALVRQALEEFEAGRLHEAQDLLESSIGAAPHRVVTSPNPEPGQPAPPEPTPSPEPVLHERELAGGVQSPEGIGGILVLAIAGASLLLGLVVVRKVR